jgi:hypothetical protein
MKLTTKDTAALNALLFTCNICDFESVIIENGIARAANESKTCAFISDFEIPNFSQTIGLTRISALRQRLDIFAGNNNTEIDAKESDKGEISSLEISAGKNKVQFRCTSTQLIKAPKSINGNLVNRVGVKKEELKMVFSAIKAMGAKKILLTIRQNGEVSFRVSDATNDDFVVSLDEKVQRLSDESMDSTAHYYDAAIFSNVFKPSYDEFSVISFDVGDVGIIQLKVNGHNVVLIPQINEDEDD